MQPNEKYNPIKFVGMAMALIVQLAFLFVACSTSEGDEPTSEEPAPSSASDTVDFIEEPNENEVPVFGSNAYAFSLEENTTEVGAVQAEDADGDALTYSLSESSELFEINSENGTLSVAEGQVVDYEANQTNFNLQVEVTDGSAEPQSVAVAITITDQNDNAPAFSSTSYAFDLAENAALGAAVGEALTATDVDTVGALSFSLESQSPEGPVVFELNSQTGQLSLGSSGVVPDFESGDTNYTLTVGVSDGVNDGAQATVAITITDEPENENAPVFSSTSYAFDLAENTALGTAVGEALTATDVDTVGAISFSLESQSPEGPVVFELNSQTGQLSLGSSGVVPDFESGDTNYTLTVGVSDGANDGVDATVVITITDENDTAPSLTSASLARDVAENSALGANVGSPLLVDDPDGFESVNYSLTGQLPPGPVVFEVDSQTGQVSLAGSGSVPDFDSGPTNYTLTIATSDGTNTSSGTEVVIAITDENDTAPSFDQTSYSIDVEENKAILEVVGTFGAIDVDTVGSLTYQLLDHNPSGPVVFEVDSDTGRVRLSGSGSSPDFEVGPTSYTLTLGASDGVHPEATTSILVAITDENDNAPVFSEASYTRSIPENTALGTAVGDAISATDVDSSGTLAYSLVLQVPPGPAVFEVDSQTGQVSLASSGAAPDFESGATSYALTLGVFDGVNNGAEAQMTIAITDENDTAPSFASSPYSLEVAENTALGTAVGEALQADDPDTSGTLAYSLVNQAPVGPVVFEVDSQTGQVSLASSGSVPDFESSVNSYTLTVGVSDGTNPGTPAQAIVTITDENDGPIFTQSSYDYPVHPNVQANASFGPFEAPNNEGNPTTYSITGGTHSSLFTVNNVGTLSQGTNPLASGTTYNVVLTASASGVDVDATINIHVIPNSSISVTGDLTNTIGELLLGDITTIGISTPLGNLNYEIASSTPTDATNFFNIDAGSGALSKTAALSFDLRPAVHPEITLDVRGASGLNPQFSHTTQVRFLVGGEVIHDGMVTGYYDGAQDADGNILSKQLRFGVQFHWMIGGNRYLVKPGTHTYIYGIVHGDFTEDDATNGEYPNFFRLSLDEPSTNINLNGTNYRFGAAHIYFDVNGNVIQGRLHESVGSYPVSNWIRFNTAGEVVECTASKSFNWNGVDNTGFGGVP